MAPTPRELHRMDEAGLHTSQLSSRSRGRRFICMGSSDFMNQKHNTLEGEELSRPSPVCLDTSERTGALGKDTFCGLSSNELSKVFDHHHRRGRRLICHGQSKCLAQQTPSNTSLVSEPISESSIMDHLGHRDKVRDERYDRIAELELQEEEERAGGIASHHLSHKGTLGLGKRRFGIECPWVGYHKARGWNDPGGADCDDLKRGSFLGPSKRTYGNIRADQEDNLFSDVIPDSEKHTKKLFQENMEPAVHATEEIPLGVSSQVDLHTKGFLGRSRKHHDRIRQRSSDPVTHRSEEPTDSYDLASYGLSHRGKRKFLVQSNLEPGCRHNMSRPETKSMPTLHCSSAPVLERELPPNQTPYYQDDLPESQRAIKDEVQHKCQPGTEAGRRQRLRMRDSRRHKDNTWSCLAWTPRKVDDMSAAKFIEGQDIMHAIPDEEYREEEFRTALQWASKRSYGNAHNKSDFRFDYGDKPGFKTEHYVIRGQHLYRDSEDDNRKWDRALAFGEGHGRKRFDIPDHLDKADDGVECYRAVDGTVLSQMIKRRVEEDHIDPANESVAKTFWIDPNGKPHIPRQHVPVEDQVDGLLTGGGHGCQGESNFDVPGMRRSTELIVPKSARNRFPEKDFDRTPRSARSVTPRGLRPSSSARSLTPPRTAFGSNQPRFK